MYETQEHRWNLYLDVLCWISIGLVEKTSPAASCVRPCSLSTWMNELLMMSVFEISFQFNFFGKICQLSRVPREIFHLLPTKIAVMLLLFSDIGEVHVVVLFVLKQHSHSTKRSFQLQESILLFNQIYLHAYLCGSKWLQELNSQYFSTESYLTQ